MFIKYHLFFYCLSILLAVIAVTYHPVFYLFLVGYYYFCYHRLQKKSLLLMILLTIIFVFTMRYPSISTATTVEGTIIQAEEDRIVLKTLDGKIKIYGEFKDFNENDVVKLEIEYFDIPEPRNDNAFNYQQYLYSVGITTQATCINILDHVSNSSLYTSLKNRVASNDQVGSFASLFLLGVKDSQMEDYYLQLTDLSIVHLFALSGMHIHLLKKWLQNIFQYFISPRILNYLIVVLLGLYVYILPYNISFIRAYSIMLLLTLFKKYLNALDALSIVTVVTIFLNPYVVYHISFIFSYFIYFVVILVGKHRYSNYLIYLASIPIILSIQYRINILSIILGVIVMPLVSILYQLLLWYAVLGSLLKPFVQIVINIFTNIVLFSGDISLYIPFTKPTLFFILTYYFYFFRMLLLANCQKRYGVEICKILSVVLMFYLYPYYSTISKVVMIDVGQGDSFLIKQAHHKGNILIDTGGLKNNDVAKNTLIPYLRSEGIDTLDYVFISHDDFDHNGAYEGLVKGIQVKNTVDEYIEKMTIGDVEIEMYQVDIDSSDTNDKSLVFKVTFNGLRYLFTGDSSVEVEEALYNTYGTIDVDVLKVSHHGSNTATSNMLLKMTTPKMALISCGKNNLYRHPNKEVIERLKSYGVHIYRTDQMGMVSIVNDGQNNYIYR